MKENGPKNRKPKEHEHEGPEAEEVRGTVVQYLLDPRGEVDGLLLDDGIFIKFPPHLGAELMQVASQYGTSIGVAMLGSTKESFTLIAPAPHRPKKPRAHGGGYRRFLEQSSWGQRGPVGGS